MRPGTTTGLYVVCLGLSGQIHMPLPDRASRRRGGTETSPGVRVVDRIEPIRAEMQKRGL